VDKLGSRSWEDSQIDVSKTFAEMRHLGQAFNMMSEKLRTSYNDLEDTVEERTHMLREANEQLKQKGTELQRINSLLSDSDRKKSGMMAAISGELRQPLGAIIAFTQNVLDNSYSHQDQVRYLGDIMGNAQMLDDQVSDLMSMSQIEAGLMSLDYTEFKFEDILKDIRKIVNPIVERKSLKFSVDIDAVAASMVADENKIKHVLRNLLSNAVKYTPEGGWIRVKVEPLMVEGQQDMVLIQVSDSGVGIKPENLSSVFTQIWQGEQGVQSGQENHGLGLAIVKVFVELHGGTIDVKSIWQKGTLFSIRLPVGLDEF
jgi:signal transduction histidine kinase